LESVGFFEALDLAWRVRTRRT